MAEKLFVFTASGTEAYKHYIRTIEEGFTLEEIKQFLSEKDFEIIKTIFGERKIRAWGATSGAGNLRTWNSLETGDRILIYRQLNYEHIATIAYKFHNREFAEHLWGADKAGNTWEYIYLLDNLTEISVPLLEFNKLFGYSESYIPGGFMQISEDRINLILQQYKSIDEFLNFLIEGKWVVMKKELTEIQKEKIIQERVSKQIGRTELLEENLENFIAEHIDQIDPHLKLIDRQKVTDVGRIDLLCSNDDLVVIELKKMKAGPSIIDQISRYMGWVKKHIASENRKVRGIIIVGKKDTYLEYAAAANPLIEVKEFKIAFT